MIPPAKASPPAAAAPLDEPLIVARIWWLVDSSQHSRMTSLTRWHILGIEYVMLVAVKYLTQK